MTFRFVSNVLCVKRDNQWVLNEREIASRLSYFQLIELTRVNRLRFPPSLHDWTRLTPRQESQRRAFLRERMTHLWDTAPGFKPIPGASAPNPFFARHKVEPREVRELPASPNRLGIGKARKAAPVLQQPAEKDKRHGPDEQAQVVMAPPEDDLFVIAPPGTGKTHVLVERIAQLVKEGHTKSAAEEVLVLSYTRSAVAEVRRRLLEKLDQGAHPDVSYARVLTFDSLATRSIMLDRPPDFLQGRDFSERIALFNQLIRSQLPNALESLAKVKFLFVDEVQDLSGHRAEMVLNIAGIVKQAGGAVCFLGDPAQAIYDFDEEAGEILESTKFLEQLSDGIYCAKPPKRVPLEQYRRFETEDMLKFVSDARHAMGDDGLHPDGGQLATLLGDLGDRVTFEEIASWIQGSGTRSILTRTNLEAYQIWALCDGQEINAELWRGASGNYWPGWIARLVLGFKQDVMPVKLVEDRWRQFVGPLVRLSFEDALAFFDREGALADGRLDLVQLNRLIANGAPAATRKTAARVTISTIHRSKGLEFDEVLLYSPRQNFAGKATEVRVIYVASTRAKRRFRIVEKIATVKQGARNSHWLNLRTYHFHIRGQPQQPFGLLIDGADEVDRAMQLESPTPEALRETAKYVWDQAGAGVSHNLEIFPVAGSDASVFVLGGRPIAVVAQKLHSDLQKLARWQSRSFDRCSGLQLVDLATHAYDIEDHRAKEAFGAACLGLGPVVSGIAAVHTR